MKILNTLQELWDYCLYCPVCKDTVRTIHVSVGPDDAFILKSYKKNKNILELRCAVRLKKREFKVNYNINCQDNSFEFDISDPESCEVEVNKASAPYFYFYIQSDCKKCLATHTNGRDLELDLFNNKITNIGIEREGIYLLDQKTKYHITLVYDIDEMIISRCYENESGVIIDDNKPFQIPIIDLDFSDPVKVTNKIKMMLLFS